MIGETRPEAVRFQLRLGAFRSRLRLVLGIKYVIVGLFAAVALGILALAQGGVDLAVRVVAVTAGVAVPVGCGAAWARSPNLAATAVALDRRQHLEERAATALQCSMDPDPVGVLVLRDASARILRLAPAEVFPLELRSIATPAALAAAAVGVAAVFFLFSDSTQPWRWRPPTGGQIQAGGTPRTTPPSPNAAAERRPPTDVALASGAVAPPRPSARAAAIDRDPRASRGSAARDDVTVNDRQAPQDPASVRASGGTPAAGANAQPRSQAPRNGAASVQTGSSAPTASAAAGSASGAGTVGSGSASTRFPSRAGGVGRGSLQPTAVEPAVPPGATSRSDAYRTAWARSQAMLGDAPVRLHQREYVSRYFHAIRPGQVP